VIACRHEQPEATDFQVPNLVKMDTGDYEKMAREKDGIALVKGERVPLVLRQVNSDEWQLIGECYIHGIMHGAAFSHERCKDTSIVEDVRLLWRYEVLAFVPHINGITSAKSFLLEITP
jgi:hypothetical protein